MCKAIIELYAVDLEQRTDRPRRFEFKNVAAEEVLMGEITLHDQLVTAASLHMASSELRVYMRDKTYQKTSF